MKGASHFLNLYPVEDRMVGLCKQKADKFINPNLVPRNFSKFPVREPCLLNCITMHSLNSGARNLIPGTCSQHVPKDLNPDLLVWNQQCYRYTKDVKKWERKESHLSPTTTPIEAGGLQPPVWRRSQLIQAEDVGLEPTTAVNRNCFQDSLLIQPDTFHG